MSEKRLYAVECEIRFTMLVLATNGGEAVIVANDHYSDEMNALNLDPSFGVASEITKQEQLSEDDARSTPWGEPDERMAEEIGDNPDCEDVIEFIRARDKAKRAKAPLPGQKTLALD